MNYILGWNYICYNGDIKCNRTTDNRITFAAENIYWSGIEFIGNHFSNIVL